MLGGLNKVCTLLARASQSIITSYRFRYCYIYHILSSSFRTYPSPCLLQCAARLLEQWPRLPSFRQLRRYRLSRLSGILPACILGSRPRSDGAHAASIVEEGGLSRKTRTRGTRSFDQARRPRLRCRPRCNLRTSRLKQGRSSWASGVVSPKATARSLRPRHLMTKDLYLLLQPATRY
jgi:hypothetical protein